MKPTQETRSVGELLRDLAHDSATLIRQELVLARTEAHDKLQQKSGAGVESVGFAALMCAGRCLGEKGMDLARGPDRRRRGGRHRLPAGA